MIQFELVLPCYNESKSLEVIIRRAIEVAEKEGLSHKDFRLVLVENGSKDNSREVLENLFRGELANWFRPVMIDKNQGYGNGIFQGLLTTQAPIVGWSHADQQCDPADAIRAWKMVRDSGKSKILVKGIRSGRNWKDILVSRIFDVFATLFLKGRFYEINAQPKVFPRYLISELKDPPKDFTFDVYALFQAKKLGMKFETIPVLFPPRVHGLSHWAGTFMSRHKTILGFIRYMWSLGRKEGQR